MNTTQVHVERRAAQRFEFHLPVSIRVAGQDGEAHGFTRDLSARGAFFYTESALTDISALHNRDRESRQVPDSPDVTLAARLR